MFNSISWQEFLATISLIACGYYAISSLLLYGEEIKSFFNQSASKHIKHDASEDQIDSNQFNDLMGEVKYNKELNVSHEKLVEPRDIQVQESEEIENAFDNVILNTPDALIAKALMDLRQNINALISEYKQEPSDEIASLFRSLLQSNQMLIGTSHQEELTDLIHKSLDPRLSFTPEQVKSWWAEETENSLSTS